MASSGRLKIFYYVIVAVIVVFIIRLFYLQILRGSYYEQQALASQLKQFEIPAERGSIYAFDGEEVVPLVLNETRYRIVADPQLIKDVDQTAERLSGPLGMDVNSLKELLGTDSRYVVLANKQTKEKQQEVERLELPGIFTHEKVPLRVYVQGQLAPQVLGFVDDAGTGKYGVEQSLNDELTGTAGRVKALTDQNNVPLLAAGDNVLTDPIDGKDIVLTLDISVQRQVEKLLELGLKRAQSASGSVVVLDATNGAVKAMANYPTFDLEKFAEVEDPSVFANTAVSSPLEPGSIMKVLTSAAALDSGSVRPDQTYNDPGFVKVDDATIKNVAGGATDHTSISDILQYSLNTGATWLLKQMGGGDLNEAGRTRWHEYMTQRYNLGKLTGIEQGEGLEDGGVVPDPIEGYGLNIRYANTSFGQGMTATPIQMVAAVASVVNGGTYYRPTLVYGERNDAGDISVAQPVVVRNQVVSTETSNVMRDFMENVIKNNLPAARRDGYRVGGKTGTAEIANPTGGYYADRFNGMYVGFVGGDTPQYVVIVRVNEPKIPGFAGSAAAAPLFADVSNMLIDNFSVSRTTR